jgi:hypothetical protein
MNKHWPIAFGVLGLIVGVVVAAAANVKNAPDEEGIHYHAGFQVYANNELQDFADLTYMKQDPCSDKHEVTDSPEEEQLEKAHLHDVNGDVVHVHRDHATWGDLFTNMEYEFPDDTRIAYVNGERLESDILHYELKADDSVVIFIGTNTDINSKLADAVTIDRIREVESLSEDCGSD